MIEWKQKRQTSKLRPSTLPKARTESHRVSIDQDQQKQLQSHMMLKQRLQRQTEQKAGLHSARRKCYHVQ